jgi:hypothetical protein
MPIEALAELCAYHTRTPCYIFTSVPVGLEIKLPPTFQTTPDTLITDLSDLLSRQEGSKVIIERWDDNTYRFIPALYQYRLQEEERMILKKPRTERWRMAVPPRRPDQR